MGWMDEQGNLNPAFKTPEQGASTSIWAAVGHELEGVGGLYLEDVREALPFDAASPFGGYMPYARDPQKAEALWALSEELVGTLEQVLVASDNYLERSCCLTKECYPVKLSDLLSFLMSSGRAAPPALARPCTFNGQQLKAAPAFSAVP